MATFPAMGGPILAAANVVNNTEVWQYRGDNATVGTAYEGINGGNADQVHPAILGEDIDVLSSDNTDDIAATGEGAQEITIKYLDSSFLPQTALVVTNGTSAVELTDQNITFINDAYISDTGTLLNSTGAIDIAAPGGSTMGTIDAGQKYWNNTKCMVPADSKGYIYGFWGAVTGTGTPLGLGVIALQIAYAGASGVANSEVWETVAELNLVEPDSDTYGTASNPPTFEFPGGVPWVVPAKAMVRLAAKATSTAVACTAGFSIVISGNNAGTQTTNS
jgi:hypothetical protein